MKANTPLNLGFSSVLAAVLWLGAGPPLFGGAVAAQHGGHGDGGKAMMAGKGKPMKGGEGGDGGMGGGLYGADWESTLTDEQQARLDELKVRQKKMMMPMKARARAIRADLVTMALADDPDERTLSSKVDEMLSLRRQMMMAKFRHIMARREVLTPEQRRSFDVHVMKKMSKKGGGH